MVGQDAAKTEGASVRKKDVTIIRDGDPEKI
jgi:hypothetical protein